MAKIGSYGDIVFEVSKKKTQTFNEFEREGSTRWNDHEIINLKPISEFNGPNLDEISITITLKAELGINPVKQIEKLRAMKDKGKAAPFIIGGKTISKNNWVIDRMTESHKVIDNKGNTLTAEVTLSLREYVIKPKKKKKTVSKKKASSASTSSKKKKTLGKIKIIVKSVHIRSSPSTSGKVLGYAFNGDTLTVYSVKNGWYSLGKGKYITANSKYSTLEKG